ncbi:MAG: type II and III secretion system protein family protein [Pseudomonadota bacterium]
MNFFFTRSVQVGLALTLALLLLPIEVYAEKAHRSMSLEQDTAEIFKLDSEVTEIFVANPDIADIQLNSPKVAYVFGKKPGVTTVFATDAGGNTVLELELDVTHNLRQLNRIVRTAYPDERVRVQSSPAGIVLSGKVTSAQTAKNIENITSRYLGTNQLIVNNMNVSQPTQVYLKVRVAEVQRRVLDILNINWASNIKGGGSNPIFGVLTGRNPFDPAVLMGDAFARNTDGLSSIGYRHAGNTDVTGLIDALDKESLASILAEPNLVCMSGRTASFLAGGEFPYPVPQGDNNTTIEFKEFGISLSFTPTVLSKSLINLRVRPEVSDVSDQNAVTLPTGAAGQVFRIPSIVTRRAETSVELGSGDSLAIAGLFSNNIRNSLSELPGLADIPILGALFRSTEFQRDETELVIIVTVYTVNPVKEEDLSLPTDGLMHAHHMGTILMKRLNRLIYGTEVDPDPRTNRSDTQPAVNLVGAAGFHVE